ncbi:Lrp/AsnC family transcriptional regulator [Microbacterium sp. MPKO10]|uniref:Lrp/AsnC family transcriptional regulator n=1 Tax=Microbacterium sp. MPKO10 TaxID=2989818 RepID=UPI002236BB3D|nr:Lrp/AsnC family transcriptional regulator [Microbacterium sp. MPKO10]MCW4459866.1 Lrp/AsnC family transcriptional regulator [Microbacterium sp. MPKO10]
MFRTNDELDEVDLALLSALRVNARATNRQLAFAAGVAESTSHTRVQRLEERGVIAGYEAVVRQRELGAGLQAVIGVTLRAGARQASITEFSTKVRALPEVTQMFFLGSSEDFLVHVAVSDSSALRTFVVENLSGNPTVASTRTSIIIEYSRNTSTASFG